MILFHHHGGSESGYITQFQIRQGDRSASLSWELRDRRPREILVFESIHGFVEDDADPTADHGQRLVYQGSDLHARLTGAGASDNDVGYRYPDDIVYYYSVFARGDDGNPHLQLIVTAAPRSVGCWVRADSVPEESESPRGTLSEETDRELAQLARR